MFSRLNNNYLVLEVWKDGSLFGISKIQTESLHTGFKQFRVPQIIDCFVGRIPIMDLLKNIQVGELQVSLRAGTSKYILPEKDVDETCGGEFEPSSKRGSFNQSSIAVQTSFLGRNPFFETECKGLLKPSYFFIFD